MTNRYGLPKWVITSDAEDSAAGGRVKVESQNTAFYRGREFRGFLPLAVSDGVPMYFKFVAPIDFVLWSQTMVVDDGAIRFEVFVGATPTGSWAPISTTIGKNRTMSRPLPLYAQQVTIESGGTFTGGTLVDLHIIRTSAQTVTTSSTGGQIDKERGLPQGTFYLKFSQLAGVNGSSSGVYYLDWEELA